MGRSRSRSPQAKRDRKKKKEKDRDGTQKRYRERREDREPRDEYERGYERLVRDEPYERAPRDEGYERPPREDYYERPPREEGGYERREERRRARSRSYSPPPPRRRSPSPDRRSPTHPVDPNLPGSSSAQPILIDQPEEAPQMTGDDEADMMKLMGFSGFDSTKGKHVNGNNVYVANVQRKRRYRQYMNRRGGFNRPLDFIA